MPELPEVETIVKQLTPRVVGKRIVSVEVLDTEMVDSSIKKIVNSKILNARRRAKYIIIELTGEKYLLVHLGMTGHFHYLPKAGSLGELEKFVVAKFYLDDSSLLTHNSIRKFGSIRLLGDKELEKELAKLGPEPLAREFTLDRFNSLLLKKKKSVVKTLLMDQKFIAGVGNIYAQEVLYHAKIGPHRTVESLTSSEVRRLYQQLRRVLELAVKHHGTTVENYVHIEGSGGFQKYLAVYHRIKCPKSHPVKRLEMGGRGTYYCPSCQS